MQTHLTFNSKISQGEKLFEEKCSLCHSMRPCVGSEMYSVTGPDMQLISNSLQQKFVKPDGTIQLEEANLFLTDYVYFPDQTKAIMEQSVINRYGIMPSLKGSVTDEEIRHIAEFIMTVKSE
ncbi:MAG: c-type cytochrome [Bacteroidales bacterium]|nr:c-type cytochrome [Bacteroidales bacterium]